MSSVFPQLVTLWGWPSPVIFMQCGPVRHRVDPRSRAARRTFQHFVHERVTAFSASGPVTASGTSVPAIFAALAGEDA